MKFYKKPVLHGKLDRHGRLIKTGKQVVLYDKYDGFGIPVDVLRVVKGVEIHYKGVVYHASVEDFKKHGIPETYDKGIFDKEEQYILPRKYWKVVNQASLL